MVGKRRKRPLPDSKLSESKGSQWNVTIGPTTLPSPAPTSASEPHSKRSCISSDWSNLVQYDDQTPLDFSGCAEQFLNLDLCQPPETMASGESSYLMHSGLPTPSMSPPEMKFLTPSDLEATTPNTRPPSTGPVLYDNSEPILTRASTFYHQRPHSEDDETIAIKLLAHLKRFSIQERQSFQSVASLVNKTNAALRRLLRSDTVKNDYTCHLLLTNIMMHLAAFCEQLMVLRETPTEQDLIAQSALSQGENDMFFDQRSQGAQQGELSAVVKNSIYESATLCTSIGNLLKRKPLNGFQVLGRHESAQLDIERRLRDMVSSMS